MNLEELDHKIRSDFRVFLTLVWKELDLPKPTRAQLSIADYLQNGPKRLQISAFRGVGKSWITAAFVLWIPISPHIHSKGHHSSGIGKGSHYQVTQSS